MERNKEIATSANLADSLTEQQCDVLEWASDMRHVMHKNSEALYDCLLYTSDAADEL